MEHDGTIIPCAPKETNPRFLPFTENLTTNNHPSFPYHTRGTCEAAKHWSDLLWSLAFSTWRIIFISIGRGLSYFFGVQPYLPQEQTSYHHPHQLKLAATVCIFSVHIRVPPPYGPSGPHFYGPKQHPTSRIFGILADPD